MLPVEYNKVLPTPEEHIEQECPKIIECPRCNYQVPIPKEYINYKEMYEQLLKYGDYLYTENIIQQILLSNSGDK
jgi:hypothetical protein